MQQALRHKMFEESDDLRLWPACWLCIVLCLFILLIRGLPRYVPSWSFPVRFVGGFGECSEWTWSLEAWAHIHDEHFCKKPVCIPGLLGLVFL